MSQSNIRLQNIQKSLYQYLSNNLSVKVENRIDPDTQKPYLAMGDLMLRRDHARKLEGFEVTQELVVYSNFNGKDEVIKIIDDIRALIASRDIAVENVNVHTQGINDISISQYDVAIYEGQLYLTISLFDF